ncbi:IS1182 family transposase [Rathayibacter soli]
MHKRFKPFDPDLVMMVPPSLDEWLPEVHLSRFIADVVDSQLDLSKFYASYAKAKGQPPYDPRLMVRVLLYGYCVGVRSSRELERACVDVVAFRWLTAQQAPDFRSIARFRKRHLSALGNVFLQALELCRAAGMVSLGQVALDGTKVRANASRRKAMSYARLTQRQKVLAEEVSDLLAEAEAIDTAEDTRFGKDKRGDELPAELARRETRLGKLAQARAALEADAAAKARKDAEQKAREHGDEDGAVKEKGQDAAAKAVVGPKTQRNFTDPDSRIMKTADGSFHYCYNGFCLVDKDHQVIVSNDMTNTPNDFEQLAPMIQKAEATLGVLPGQVLVDAGFCSVKNLEFAEGIEEASAGKTEFFIATRRLNAAEEAIMGTGQQQAAAATAKLRMVQRLRSKHGHDIYARRKAIVEPVFGQIHTRQGKHVLLRGLDQAKHEWDLIAGCHNLLKLFSATTARSMNGLGT